MVLFDLIDFILNVAGLLLWISWRNLPFDPVNRLRPATLTGTLRRAEPLHIRRWHFLAALGALLLVRALFYRWIGGALGWVPGVDLGAVTLSFRSDLLWSRALPYSLGSFAHALATFYAWLLLFSFAIRSGDSNPGQAWVKLQLGGVGRWPRWVRAALPFGVMTVLWLGLSPVLQWLVIIPAAKSAVQVLEQAVIVGLGGYLFWKFAIVAVLALHLLDSYVYLGASPLWNFVNSTGRWLLQPLRRLPLRFGKMDFAPLVGIAATLLLARLIEGDGDRWGLAAIFRRLPF